MFFIPQANNTQLTRKEREMWNITTKALLHLGGILVVDVFFHYLYILTIPSDMKLVTKLSDWCLGEFDKRFHTVAIMTGSHPIFTNGLVSNIGSINHAYLLSIMCFIKI